MNRLLSLIALTILLMGGSVVFGQTIMQRLINPGPLSAAHAKLEANCEACHQSFSREAQNNKCLSCHKPIGADIARHNGYHGKAPEVAGKACKACHTDHKGRGFGIVQFNRTSFNHHITNYPLVGAHGKVACTSCHTGHNFRGTPANCYACHAKKDQHFGRLGKNCQSCHSEVSWKQRLPFDHGKTGFALIGGHRTTACLACHIGERWAATPTSCIACHAKNDVHKGSRGTACGNCHNPGGWKNATFNHNTDTNFPLVGKHISTTCAGCHGVNNSIPHPPRNCNACHDKDDAHKGTFGPKCENCHIASSWKNTIFDHSRTAFPLFGKHVSATCASCHGVNNSKPKPEKACNACHAKDDVHKGKNGINCAECHNAKSWKDNKFDHNTMTHFPLLGAHRPLECGACHKEPAHKVKLAVDCLSCHAKDDAHKGKLGAVCQACHDTVKWNDKVQFDHGLTHFPLLGKHFALKCEQCHADKTFTAKGTACAACHEDTTHKGSLGAKPDCALCHNANDWKLWQFNHSRQTKFPLTGKHDGLVCSACHNRPSDPAKISVVCADCHQHDDIHHGDFGPTCEKCHTTTDWKTLHM